MIENTEIQESKIESQETEILLGQYLKEKRQNKNFTLEKLSQKTKISVNILKSLEQNDFDNLPSAAYIKGFVTSYVKVLGLPIDEAINKMEFTYLKILGKPFPALNHTKLFHPNSNITPKPEEKETPVEMMSKVESIVENSKSFFPFAVLFLVIGMIIGGYKMVANVIDHEINDQKSKNLGPKIESSSALVVRAKTENPKSETSSKESTGNEQKTEETPAEKPFERNFPPVEFKKIRGELFSVIREAVENTDSTILPEQIKASMNSDLQNIYIKAVSGNTWLSYKIDEKPIESVIINQNTDLFLQGNEIRIFLGNVNVTKIFYNNNLIDTPTKTGVKSLVFPQESGSKYFLPLFPKAKDDVLYTAEDYMKRMKVEEEELARRQ
jgi:cytoskeleton protein RodZ